MAIGSFGFALALMLLLLVVGAQNTDLVSYSRNTEIIPTGSPFFDTLGNLIADLEDNTAYGYDYSYDYKSSMAGSPTAYGEAICSHALPYECTTCLTSLGDRIWGIRNNAIGAQVQLTGCSMRYQQYNF